jgi:Siphovirus Gp157
MASLYEIAQNIKQLEELLEAMDEGDATYETIKEYLDSRTDIDLTNKVDNILRYIKNLEADAEMYKNEKKRLDALEKSSAKKAENLKNYLVDMLHGIGYNHKNKKKLQTSIGTVSFKKSPPKLEVLNIDKVPTEWDKPQQREVRKAELLKYAKELIEKEGINLKDEDKVELSELGIVIVNDNSSLQIK